MTALAGGPSVGSSARFRVSGDAATKPVCTHVSKVESGLIGVSRTRLDAVTDDPEHSIGARQSRTDGSRLRGLALVLTAQTRRVRTGIIAGLAQHPDVGTIENLRIGTTVATNAVLEHKIARVGLIVTEGYRHILQIARSLVPGGLAAWIIWPKPEPMAPLEATIEAPERIGADGAIVRALDEAQLRLNLKRLAAEKVEAITVCLKGTRSRIMAFKMVRNLRIHAVNATFLTFPRLNNS